MSAPAPIVRTYYATPAVWTPEVVEGPRDARAHPRPGDRLRVGEQDVEVIRIDDGHSVTFRRSGMPGFTCTRQWYAWRRFCRGES